MANKYEKYAITAQEDDPDTYVLPGVAASGNKYEKYNKAPEVEAAPEKENSLFPLGADEDDPAWQKILSHYGAFSRAAVDGATFGTASKVGEAALGDRAQSAEEVRERHPYTSVAGDVAGLMVPGGLISKGLGKAAPWLAKNTYGSIAANQALTGATTVAADSAIRNQELPDPLNVGIAAGTGAVLGPALTAAGRYISPKARVRGYGADVDEATRQAAGQFADDAAQRGIPLTAPEAVSAVAPKRGARLNAEYEMAANTPEGAIRANQFNAARGEQIRVAGDDMVQRLGAPISPFDISSAAQGAIKSADDIVGNSSRPYYQAAEPIQAGNLPRTPATKKAAKSVQDNPIVMGALKNSAGGEVSKRSVLYQDAVKKELDAMQRQSSRTEGNALQTSAIMDEISALRNRLDAAAPDYATARSIEERGRSMVDQLKQGPLGQIANNPASTSAQGGAVFGVTNEAERMLAENALRRLPQETQRGLLANQIDSAVSQNPAGFGRTALPTKQSRDLAQTAAGGNDDVMKTLDTALAVNAPVRNPSLEGLQSGPIPHLWAQIRNFGDPRVVDLLNDPRTAAILGTQGNFQRGMTLGATASGVEATRQRRQRTR